MYVFMDLLGTIATALTLIGYLIAWRVVGHIQTMGVLIRIHAIVFVLVAGIDILGILNVFPAAHWLFVVRRAIARTGFAVGVWAMLFTVFLPHAGRGDHHGG